MGGVSCDKSVYSALRNVEARRIMLGPKATATWLIVVPELLHNAVRATADKLPVNQMNLYHRR